MDDLRFVQAINLVQARQAKYANFASTGPSWGGGGYVGYQTLPKSRMDQSVIAKQRVYSFFYLLIVKSNESFTINYQA